MAARSQSAKGRTDDYAESIASRGAKNADRRAELSDDLFAAGDRLVDAVLDIREAIVLPLEAQPGHDRDEIPPLVDGPFLAALDAYETCRAEATKFLWLEGHIRERDDALLQSGPPWAAQVKVDEESLADALSAYLEGTITRTQFEESRRGVIERRASLDAAVADALTAATEGATAEVTS
jgi:hypothetical protein